MKKYLLYILPVVLCELTLSGCNDFLDEQPRGMAIAEDVSVFDGMFNTADLMNMNVSLYYPYALSDEIIWTESESDVQLMASTYGNTMFNAYQYKDKIYNDNQKCEMWESCYNKIYAYNVIANGVPDASGSDKEKQYLEAEARASRAFMHFLLAQWFAMPYEEATAASELAVPIVTEANTQVFDYQRATVKELYEWVVSELEYAAPRLEDREEHKMRVYQPTGYALLGKVYFFMHQYDKAREALRKAYDMLQESETVYLTDQNEVQEEFEYMEIDPMTLSDIIPYTFNNNEVLWCKQNPSSGSFYFAYYGMQTGLIQDKFFDMYEEGDLRRNMINTYDADGYPLDHPTACIVGSFPCLGITLPEVILMLAECEARVGSAQSARDILTAFRTTRMLAGYENIPEDVTSKNDLIRYCVDEQTREFIGTGYRWYNIRRLWSDPIFQDWKPICHEYEGEVFTLQEAQLKQEIPESIMRWNNSWR